ncbi:MAG TPA: aquaporin [Patescibacteria group bacterium]|nr:aquaporin [Patescibacteria group bacterium]
MKKYVAEGLGTFALAFIVVLSLGGQFPVPTPILAGLSLGLMVYMVGGVSGSHINPAVTLGLWSIKVIGAKVAAGYIVAQIAGAALALWIASMVGVAVPSAQGSFDLMIFGAEFVGNFFFAMGIASVVFKKTHEAVSGIVVGASLFFGIAFAALIGSSGILNPAVAITLSSFTLEYILGPILGAIAGFHAYKALVAK